MSRSKLVSRETLVLVHHSGEVKPVCRRVMRVSPSRCFPEGMSLPSAFPECRRDATCCTSFRPIDLGELAFEDEGVPLDLTRRLENSGERAGVTHVKRISPTAAAFAPTAIRGPFVELRLR